MPSLITKYSCKYCKYVYDTVEEAIACEATHITLDNVQAISYNKATAWPSQIAIDSKELNKKLIYIYQRYQYLNDKE